MCVEGPKRSSPLNTSNFCGPRLGISVELTFRGFLTFFNCFIMSRINYIDEDFSYVVRAEGEETVVFPATKQGKEDAYDLAVEYGLKVMPTPERRAQVKLIKVGPLIVSKGAKKTAYRRVTILDEDHRPVQVDMWENNFQHEDAPWAGNTDTTEDFLDWVEDKGAPEVMASLQPGLINGKKVASMWVSHLQPGNGFAADISDDVFALLEEDDAELEDTTPVKTKSRRR